MCRKCLVTQGPAGVTDPWRDRDGKRKKIKTERETVWGLRHLLRYIMMMLWGRTRIRYGGHVCQRGVSICPSGLVGWVRDDGGCWRERCRRGCGERCSRLGDGVCRLNFYPRDQANRKWGVLVIKAVYLPQKSAGPRHTDVKVGIGCSLYRFALSGELCDTLS